MPKEFQHPFYKMPWLLEEEYGSLEDLDCLDGHLYLPRTPGHSVLPLWADDDDDDDPQHSAHRRPYHDGGTSDDSVEAVAPLIDPRRAVLLPGYTGDHFPVWRRTETPKYINGSSRLSRDAVPKVGIPKIEMQSPGDSDDSHADEGAMRASAGATKDIKSSDSSKSQPRVSLGSLRRSSTLTRINEFLQRARSEVFEGEDGLTAREKIRHLLRNSHVDDMQRSVFLLPPGLSLP